MEDDTTPLLLSERHSQSPEGDQKLTSLDTKRGHVPKTEPSPDSQLLSRIDQLLAHQERLLHHLSPSAVLHPSSLSPREREFDDVAEQCFVPTSPKSGRSVGDVTGDMLQRGFLDQLVWNLQLAPTGRGIRKFDPVTVQVKPPSGVGDSLLRASFGDSQESASNERATVMWAIRETWTRSLANGDWLDDLNFRPALDQYYLKHDGSDIRQQGQGRYRPVPFPSPGFLTNVLSLGKAKKDDTMTGSIWFVLSLWSRNMTDGWIALCF